MSPSIAGDMIGEVIKRPMHLRQGMRGGFEAFLNAVCLIYALRAEEEYFAHHLNAYLGRISFTDAGKPTPQSKRSARWLGNHPISHITESS
jgi:hypothetical protein